MNNIYNKITLLVLFTTSVVSCNKKGEVSSHILQENSLDFDEQEIAKVHEILELSKNGEHFSCYAPTFRIADGLWEVWSKDSTRIPWRHKITGIFLNYTSISEASVLFFNSFINATHLSVGHSCEGVYISESVFRKFFNLKKVKSLNLSIYGITDDFFIDISSMPKIESILIEFPSTPFETPIVIKKGKLTDILANHLIKLPNLKNLEIYGGRENTQFTTQMLNVLLSSKKWERLAISASCFDKSSLKEIRNRELPDFVEIE